jgi:hypothetical protein
MTNVARAKIEVAQFVAHLNVAADKLGITPDSLLGMPTVCEKLWEIVDRNNAQNAKIKKHNDEVKRLKGLITRRTNEKRRAPLLADKIRLEREVKNLKEELTLHQLNYFAYIA